MRLFFIYVLFVYSSFCHAESLEENFKLYYDKIFIKKNIKLNEAKRLRTIANAHLTGLNASSSKSKVTETHKLLMLVTELENLFPKEVNYFNSKLLMSRYYNFSSNEINQEAELQLFRELTKNIGPIQALDYLNRYLRNLENISNRQLIGFPLSLKCYMLNQLFLTDDYINCVKEVSELIKDNLALVEEQKLSLLRYYYSTSARHFQKADLLFKEIIQFNQFKTDEKRKNIFKSLHELLRTATQSKQVSQSFEQSNQLSKIDLSSNHIVQFNIKRHRSILLYKLNRFDEAKAEAEQAIKISKNTPELAFNYELQLSAKLLELFFKSISKKDNNFDYDQNYVLANESVCTQNLLHNSQLALLLHLNDYKGKQFENLSQSLQKCADIINLKNQEPQIKIYFEILKLAIQKSLSKETLIEIKNKYESIQNNFYTINYYELIIDALLKKPLTPDETVQ